MKPSKKIFIVLVAFLLSASVAVGMAMAEDDAPPVDSKEFSYWVLSRVDDMYRGESSHGIMEMTIKTKHWTRSLEMESWSLGEEYSLIKILSPRKEKGTATLKADKTLFTYLNKTGRTIKINSSMMGSSWMGSHFTNDDLVQENRRSDDFKHKVIFTGNKKGKDVHIIELVPKPGRPIVYGKIHVAILQDGYHPVWQEFFDEDGKAVKRMEFSDYRTSSGKYFAHKMKMIPLEKPREYTIMHWRKIDFKKKLKKKFFSIHNLKSI